MRQPKTESQRLYGVAFDRQNQPTGDAVITKAFPAAAAPNPEAFYPDGYSPKKHLDDFYHEVKQPGHFVVEGFIEETYEQGAKEVREAIYVTGIQFRDTPTGTYQKRFEKLRRDFQENKKLPDGVMEQLVEVLQRAIDKVRKYMPSPALT